MDAILQLLSSHRTIRDFKESPVANERVRAAVAAAQCAATSSNVQPYALLQVHDSAKRAALADCTGGQAQVAQAGAFFVLCATQDRFRKMATDRTQPFVPNFESFLVSVIDTSLFAQNLIVAFESMGLGTCCIGGLRNDLNRVRELLNVPQDVFPLFGLCVGEAASDPGPKPRLALDAVLYHDVFPSSGEVQAHIADYDATLAAYYAERGLKGRDWSGGVHRKFLRAAREDLHAFYTSQGAELR